jgi:hypothetical protein
MDSSARGGCFVGRERKWAQESLLRSSFVIARPSSFAIETINRQLSAISFLFVPSAIHSHFHRLVRAAGEKWQIEYD